MSTTSTFLPLKQFHIVEIRDLQPEKIKLSAKKVRRDREKIAYNTILNALAKALGFKCGFSGYQKSYYEELIPFLKKHKLNKRTDLLAPRLKGETFFKDITHQTLSERLFYSGQPIPKRVFTGYDFDYINTISDGHYYLNSTLCGFTKTGPFGLKNILDMSPVNIQNNLNIARNNPFETIKENQDSYYRNRTLIDIVLGGMMFQLHPSFQLVGDALIEPAKQGLETQLYLGNTDPETLSSDKELYASMFSLFRERIEMSNDGWVKVIPFNKNLIFLKGKNGEYDFVFKNQRDKAFEHQIFGESLKRADVPSCIQDYHFFRWHYFEYEGFRDRDEHKSENLFYDSGKKTADYPGSDKILFDYHLYKGNFKPQNNKSNQIVPGYEYVCLNGKNLMISNLVTIEQFNQFLNTDDYSNYRTGDKFTSVNNEHDPSFPVTTTWFDALAYLNWIEKEKGLRVRLLRADEYNELRSKYKPNDDLSLYRNTDLEFVNTQGVIYKSHPPYMTEDDFQNLTLRFKNTPKLINGKGNLKFIHSKNFAEWLLEGTCIRSGNLASFYGDSHILRCSPPKDSTGKYKGTKIGFRLCYDLDSNKTT
jgi:hypothetical protein